MFLQLVITVHMHIRRILKARLAEQINLQEGYTRAGAQMHALYIVA